jgi:hypothetical protein
MKYTELPENITENGETYWLIEEPINNAHTGRVMWWLLKYVTNRGTHLIKHLGVGPVLVYSSNSQKELAKTELLKKLNLYYGD